MKKGAWLFLVVVFIGLIPACATYGDVVSNERPLTGFESIITGGSADINVYPARDYKVIVRTEENNQGNVVVDVRGNILNIESKGTFRTSELNIDVYMPVLKAVTIRGSGDVKINDGKASGLEITISGSGDIDARNYQVENVNITSAASGDARIWATETLSGTSTGSGDILYKGNPRVSVRASASGDVKPL